MNLTAPLAVLLAATTTFAFQPAAAPSAPAQPAKAPADVEKPKGAEPAPAAQPASSPFAADKAEEVAKGYGFTEGPTWVPGAKGADGKVAPGFFIFCDMGNNKVYRYDGGTEKPVALRDPAGRAVGSTADSAGTVFQVDTETRTVSAWTVGDDGKPSAARTVADKIGEEKLGGMNDIAVAKDGTLYVTHATWFLDRGAKSPFVGVLRIAKDGSTHKANDELARPNGVCLSPDGKTLYVTEYSLGTIVAFDVNTDGTLTGKRVFADMKAMAAEKGIKAGGGADGLRCDKDGSVYSTGPGGIWAISSSGKFLGHLPQSATNIAFGGADGKTLLLTTGRGVMKVAMKVAGAGW